MKKFIVLIIFLFIPLALVSCDIVIDEPIEITLPTKYLEVEREEIIYINLLESGFINNMQASNKIVNSTFAYYIDYGYFLNENNLNITCGEAEIEILENKAHIPSLNDFDNLNYILSLDKTKYQNELPFDIEVNYFLNDYPVSFESLRNAAGIIDIQIKVTSNKKSHPYFINNYAAQLQIPINSKYNNVISANNVMSQMFVGQTLNLVYMVMPNTSEEINIKLESTNFSFAGIEATFSPFNASDLVESFLDFNSLGLNELNNIGNSLDLIIDEFNNANSTLKPLFNGFDMFNELSNIEGLDELNILITSLNSLEFKTGLNTPATLANSANRAKYRNYRDQITTIVEDLASNYNIINNSITVLNEVGNNVSKYSSTYEYFTNIIVSLENIKSLFNNINSLGDLSLDVIVNNQNMLVNSFNEIASLNETIKVNFQSLIKEIYFLPKDLQVLEQNLDLISSLPNAFNSFITNIASLAVIMEEYVSTLEIDLNNDVFTLKSLVQVYYDELVKEDGEQPSLVNALNLIVNEMDNFNLEELNQISNINELFVEDNGVNRVDQIVLGFIAMNEALTITQKNQPYSFYEGLAMLKTFSNILNIIPINNYHGPIVSFLSENNLPPTTVQFIIKQKGF